MSSKKSEKKSLTYFWYSCHIVTYLKCYISNKSFIHNPVKEKAKTFKLSFGRIGESDGISRCQGLLIKHDVRSRYVGTKYAIWVKYPLPIFNIITMPNIAQFLLKLNKKIKAAAKRFRTSNGYHKLLGDVKCSNTWYQ